jgi:hypothetical protein
VKERKPRRELQLGIAFDHDIGILPPRRRRPRVLGDQHIEAVLPRAPNTVECGVVIGHSVRCPPYAAIRSSTRSEARPRR